MRLWQILGVCLVVTVVVVWGEDIRGEPQQPHKESLPQPPPQPHDSPYNRRMTEEERRREFDRMKERMERLDKPCIPSTDPPTNTKPLPSVPISFTTKVEIAYEKENQQKVLYGSESYDGVFNMGVLRYELGEGVLLTRPWAMEEIIHYDIPKDQALTIFSDTACEETGEGNCDPAKTCIASNLEDMSKNLEELFGYGDANGDSGYYGAGGILQWGPQFEYEYKGQQDCRGLVCEKYDACISDPLEEATVHFIYLWSSPDWQMQTNGQQVPVSVEVYATGKYGHLFTRKIIQRYDFYEFYRDIRPDPDALKPSPDTYCAGRTSVYQPPRANSYFYYNSEAITGFDVSFPTGDNQTQKVQFTAVITNSEYYDWDSKIVASDYIPWFIFGHEYRYEYSTRRIQDFNQGLTYRILKNMGECLVLPIENLTSAGDVVVGDDGSVTLLPPWIYEDLDEPMQYNGVHLVRGAEADTWIGRKKFLGSILHDSYVWYYASGLTLDETKLYAPEVKEGDGLVRGIRMDEGGIRKKDPPEIVSLDKVPMRLERYLDLFASAPHLIYNLYDYQSQPPKTQELDISVCYKNSEKRSYVLDLPLDSLTRVKNQRQDLVYGAMTSLAAAGVVSPLRINRPVLESGENTMRILFTLLDKAEVVGTAPGSQLESDLDKAASLIRKAVDASQLIIVVELETFNATAGEPPRAIIVARPGTLKEVDRDDYNNYVDTQSRGYSSGSMAGLAFGMLFVGALVGLGVCALIKRNSSGEDSLPRVNLARKSPPSASNTINFVADMTSSDI